MSIIVPIYNADRHIHKCLDSIINQTYKNIEVLLIDDGSIDDSGNICKEFSDKDGRIKLYRNTNHGVSYSRNFGIEHSNGEYIFFSDSDDWLEKNCIEKLLLSMCNSGADLAVGNIIHYRSTGNIEVKRPLYEREVIEIREYLTKYYLKHKTEHMIGAPFAKLFKKSIIEQNHIRYELNESYAEDFVFNTKYYNCISKVSCINDKVYWYNVDTFGSLSKENLKRSEYIMNRQAQFTCLISELFKKNQLEKLNIAGIFNIYFAIRAIRINNGKSTLSFADKYNIFLVHLNQKIEWKPAIKIQYVFEDKVNRLHTRLFVLAKKRIIPPMIVFLLSGMIDRVQEILSRIKRKIIK